MYLRLCKLCKPKLQVKVTKDISSTFLSVFFHTFLILVNKRNVDGRAKLSAKNVLELYAQHTYLKTSYYAANVGKVARTLKQSSA